MICYKHTITEKEIEILENCINEYLKLHSKFYSNQYPKLHYLVHLPSDIRKFGPAIHFACLKFERRHQKFKRFAENSNFLNIPLTVSKKYALNLDLDLKKLQELAEKQQIFFKNGKIHKIKFEGMKIATENYVKLKNSLKIFKIAQIIQENDEIFLNCHKLVDPVYNDQLIAYSFSGISI